MSQIPVVILAGGLAKRLGKMSANTPKVLIEVRGQVFLDLKVRELIDGGATVIFILVGHLGEQIFDHVQKSNYPIPIVLISDGKALRGTGGAIISALPAIGFEKFVLTYGDNLLSYPLGKVWKYSENTPGNLLVVTNKLGLSDAYNATVDKGLVVNYSKQFVDQNTHVDYGYAVLESSTLSKLFKPSVFDLSTIFSDLARKNLLNALTINLAYEEIGTPASLSFANSRNSPKR